MKVSLYHGGQIFAVEVVSRWQDFLRIRIAGDVTGREIEIWIRPGQPLLRAYAAYLQEPSEVKLALIQDSTHCIPEETYEYLQFVRQHL